MGAEIATIRRLDDVFPALEAKGSVLLKIDTQGYELEVLKGAPRSLADIAAVYLEAGFVELYKGQPLAGELVDHLTSAGFDLVGVFNIDCGSTGMPVQADMLFERRTAAIH